MIEKNKLVKKGLKGNAGNFYNFTEKWVNGPFLAWVSCEFFQK